MHQCIIPNKSATAKLERHISCYFLIFSLLAAAHVVSNCAAINTSLPYWVNNYTICGVKKKKNWARCAVLSQLNGFVTYADITADSVPPLELMFRRTQHLARSLKPAWMAVASNPSTKPDRASPGLLTSCKHHDLLSYALLWPTLHRNINCLSSQWTLKSPHLCPCSAYCSHQPSASLFHSVPHFSALSETQGPLSSAKGRPHTNVLWLKCFG